MCDESGLGDLGNGRTRTSVCFAAPARPCAMARSSPPRAAHRLTGRWQTHGSIAPSNSSAWSAHWAEAHRSALCSPPGKPLGPRREKPSAAATGTTIPTGDTACAATRCRPGARRSRPGAAMRTTGTNRGVYRSTAWMREVEQCRSNCRKRHQVLVATARKRLHPHTARPQTRRTVRSESSHPLHPPRRVPSTKGNGISAIQSSSSMSWRPTTSTTLTRVSTEPCRSSAKPLSRCATAGTLPLTVAPLTTAFADYGVGSIAEEFTRCGVSFQPPRKADRSSGWQRMRRLLRENHHSPGHYSHRNLRAGNIRRHAYARLEASKSLRNAGGEVPISPCAMSPAGVVVTRSCRLSLI